MKKFIKYLSGFNMFAAGVMLVLLVEEIAEGSFSSAGFAAAVMAANLYCYFDIQNRRDQNESLR